jgi:hypothetical protein
MPKYKNISGKTIEVNKIGIVKPDGIINVPEGFNNANFIKVVEPPKEVSKKDNKDNKEKK